MSCILIGLVWLFPLAGLSAPPTGKPYVLAFEDNFDGTSLDLSKWSYNYPWGTYHNHMANMQSQQVTVTNGELVLTAIAQRTIWDPWGVNTPGGWKNLDYTSGAVHTKDHFWVGRGYMEGRFWMPWQWSTWPAYWMLQDGWPPEIDIFELQNERTRHHFYYHYGPDWQNEQSFGSQHWGVDKSAGWHTYGVEWEDDRMTFYLDAAPVGAWQNLGAIQQAESMYLIINLAVGGWAQDPVAAEYPAQLRCDWVKIWKCPEFLSNGDFETGRGPWNRRGATTDVLSGEGRGGSAAFRLGADPTADAAIEQTAYGLLPGTEYAFSGWARSSTGTVAATFLGVKNHGGAEIRRSTANTDYTLLTVPFVTGKSAASARLYAWQPAGGTKQAFVDDLRLSRAATVMDADFENADPDFWWKDSYGARGLSTAQVRSGSQSMSLNGAWSALQQTLRGLKPSTTYELSAWARGGGNNVLVGAKDFPGELSAPVNSNTTWTRGSLRFTTGATNTSVLVYAFMPNYNNTPAYVDDFFLAEPLAAPWTRLDVGVIGLAGTSGRVGDQFVVRGAGADIWGTADSFHFVYRPLTGDSRITARVLKVDATHPNAKAGIMIRESLAANARHAFIGWMPQQRVEFLTRTAAGGSTVSAWSPPPVTSAPWVRLERSGPVIKASWSADGSNWSLLETVTNALPATVYVGLPVCAHNTTGWNEAVFEEVSVLPIPVSLSCQRLGSNLALSWPVVAADYRLVSATSPSVSGTWTPVAQAPINLGGSLTVTLPLGPTPTYFRLTAP